MKFPTPTTRSLRFMSRFDALELHACVEHQAAQSGETFIEQEDDERNPTMFSVYGHLKSGGVFCLEDFEKHSTALAWMKSEAARCRFELGYEDFWEHGAKEQKPTGEEIWLNGWSQL